MLAAPPKTGIRLDLTLTDAPTNGALPASATRAISGRSAASTTHCGWTAPPRLPHRREPRRARAAVARHLARYAAVQPSTGAAAGTGVSARATAEQRTTCCRYAASALV